MTYSDETPGLLKTFMVFGAALFFWVAAVGPSAASERPTPEEARALVESFANEVLSLVQAPEADAPHADVLEDLLADHVNLHFVGRLVLAGHQRRATESELAAYHEVFPAFVSDRFGSLLGTYRGETFTVGEVRDLGKRDVMVAAMLVSPDGTRIPTHWRIRRFDGEPKVIDLLVENVSMVISQREEFDSVIRRDGMSGLVDRLDVHQRAEAAAPAERRQADAKSL